MTDSTLSILPPGTPVTLCRETDAPRALTEHIAMRGQIPYLEGIAPQSRPVLPGYDQGVVIMLLGVFMLMAVNVRHYTTFLKTFTHDLWQVRRRSNAFDERTLRETRITVSFVILVCVCEGIMLFSVPGEGLSRSCYPVLYIGLFSLLALVYYVFQLTAYYVVGKVFTGNIETGQWVKGFNASQALLGLALVIPALSVLFDPGLAYVMTMVSAGLYLVARFIFIIKGFRIFYTIPTSLIYFILYLCTLEIVPLFMIYRTGAFINGLELYK